MATVTGTNFQPGAVVSFDGTPVPTTWVSSTELTCSPPPHIAGAVDVKVTNPDGTSKTLTDGYTYGNGPPAGYALWLDPASLTDGAVASWLDRSAAHTFAQATGAEQPVKASTPARVTFSGTALVTCADQVVTGDLTIALAFKFDVIPTGLGDFKVLLALQSDSGPHYFQLASIPASGYGNYVFGAALSTSIASIVSTAALDTSWHRLIITYAGGTATDPASYTMLFDGVAQTLAAGSVLNVSGTGDALGASPSGGNGFPGQIKGLVAYDSALSGTPLSQLDAWLASL